MTAGKVSRVSQEIGATRELLSCHPHLIWTLGKRLRRCSVDPSLLVISVEPAADASSPRRLAKEEADDRWRAKNRAYACSAHSTELENSSQANGVND
jgi:hypothetical protein